jgi:hypothetical protein
MLTFLLMTAAAAPVAARPVDCRPSITLMSVDGIARDIVLAKARAKERTPQRPQQPRPCVTLT